MLDIILKALIALVSLAITGVVIPYVKSKTTNEQRVTLLDLIDTAVAAAEQTIKGSDKGNEKLEYVKAWLAERDVKVYGNELMALIESAVYSLKN